MLLPFVKTHPLLLQPLQNSPPLALRHLHRLMIQRRLAQPLLKNPAPMQQMIRNDRIVHPHAPLIKHPQDRLVLHQLTRQLLAQHYRLPRHLHLLQRPRMRHIMRHLPRLQPLPQLLHKKRILKILTPQCRIRHPLLRQRPVQIQHPHQPRPLPAPIRHRQNRPLMRAQSRQHMMRILPHRLRHNQRCLRIDPPKHLHPLLLTRNEPMLLLRLHRMRPLQRPSLRR